MGSFYENLFVALNLNLVNVISWETLPILSDLEISIEAAHPAIDLGLNSIIHTISNPDFLLPLFNNNFGTPAVSPILNEFLMRPLSPEEKIFPELHSDFDYLDSEIKRRHKKYPHLTIEEIYNSLDSLGSDAIEMAKELAADADSLPIDYSNLFTHKGQVLDVTKLSHTEIFHLATTVEDIDKFEALEHIRSTYIGTAPTAKLYYPEPFIASPSFVHNDLGFIHILQYQFWLWFLFIFLIVFYFISFLCVVRWCNNRTQPRRETRGVSRSKCGDLITATVPVTWAISIIVSESTDATDYYDGFGTGELIIGVRAYQWGWHYYYPKHADLNYNVKPNYSAFVGNSLKYTTTTGRKLTTNSLWKFYQTKADDAVISPAHVLVLPSDNSRILNLMNFKDLGIDTLQASKAFKQIRANARIFTTNLVHTPSDFTDKYIKINNLFLSENDLTNSNNFGIKRQHVLTSAAATTAVNSTFLDRKSLDKFLTYNLQYNTELKKTNTFNNPIDLWSKGHKSNINLASVNMLNLLLEDSTKYSSSTLRVMLSYPNILKEFGDNSDSQSINFPLRRLLKKGFVKPLSSRLREKGNMANSMNLEDSSSNSSTFFNSHLSNPSKSSKEFMMNYSYQSFPYTAQGVRTYKNLNAHTTNYNLSLGLNSLDSNLTKQSLNSNFMSPMYTYSLKNANWNDTTVFNKLASNRVKYSNIAPILSSNPHMGRLSYDKTTSLTTKTYQPEGSLISKWQSSSDEGLSTKKSYTDMWKAVSKDPNTNWEIKDLSVKSNDVVQILAGDRTGEDRSSTSSYWKMYWANANVDLRVQSLLHANRMREAYYFPTFVNYYDYDFRNSQGIRLLEDLVWESVYSGYTHQDYLNIYNKFRETYDSRSLKWATTNTLFLNPDRDYNQSIRFGTNAKSKELPNIGQFYSNSIQMDDYFVPAHLLNKRDLSEFSFINDSTVLDDSYQDQKNLMHFYVGKSSTPLSASNLFNYPQSHHAVLNNFRADYEDFSHFQDISLNTSDSAKGGKLDNNDSNLFLPELTKVTSELTQFDNSNAPLHGTNLANSTLEANPAQLNWSRFSNPIALRRSARSSMVTFQSYQKVFKLRYDEGRSHVRISDYADSAITQPYTTEQRIKYEKLLGKTKMRHFNTNYNVNKLLPVFNNFAGLNNSLNYYFYEFPFLDGVTSDPTRHVWFDGFVRFAQREVGGSSVSKYTIVGVPFYKKKYDFNVKQGKQFSDSELYFSRIITARKNYLPQWLHTPYLYTRSNVWYAESRIKLLSRSYYKDITELKRNLKRMEWYWNKPTFSKTTSHHFTPSFSNSHKSTFRPYASIQAYYYNLNTLTDILSRREYLYRQALERRNKIIELPKNLRATPTNPLISEIKSSFLLIDPITYNSEYSRELYYHSLSYFKFMFFKDWIISLNSTIRHLPINVNLVNEYLFFHFLNEPTSKDLGNRSSFRKSQFKPLKKGITSMMRLQGTGAVAMPIEIRLQILASSKDVIHSWAIPSAGIKIDCIPGYTSHRIMIFFNPGIYWGQCMEICGRYHHWMPIIVYFMKRDLFFLWCTHFLSKKDPFATKFWESNDRQFADYIGFISYNKSTWLTELGRTL